MADQFLILDSAEAVAKAAPLLPTVKVCFVNGTVPEELRTAADVVVFGRVPDWVADTSMQFAMSNCPRLRLGRGDVLEIDDSSNDAAANWLRARIADYKPNPAPQADETHGSSPVSDASEPAGAGHTDERDEDEAAEKALRSIRIASNIVKLRSVEAREEWSEPEEQFSETSDLPEFDPQWIAPPLRDFVVNIHQMQGCDLGIPAMHALTVAAGLITDDIKVSVRKEQEWYESPRIWSCVLGRSGDGKSPALRAITREVKVLWTEVAEVSKRRMAKYKLDMEVYEAQKRMYVTAKAKGDPAGVAPDAPMRPVDEQIYFDSSTVEAIADVLQDSSRGSMLLNDELLGWLCGFNQYRQGNDRQFFLEAFDGGRRVFNRVGRRWILDSGLSICGNSQPGAFRRAMSNMSLDSDGLIQRVLIYNSLRDADSSSEVPADQLAIKRWRRIAHGLYHLKPHLEPCYFSAKAQDIFRQAEAWTAETRKYTPMSDAMQEHLSKYRGYLARIALTLHCIDCADSERAAVTPEIQEDTVYRAWMLLRDCLFHHATRFYGEIAGDTSRRKALRQITNFIICRPDMALTLRRRDLELQCREAWYPETSATIRDGIRRELLNELIGMGWIRAASAPDRIGKLPAEFAINPRLDAKFAAVRAAEIPRRQATRAKLEEQKAAKRSASANPVRTTTNAQ